MRRSGGCAGTSYAGNGQAAYENNQPEKYYYPICKKDTFVEVPTRLQTPLWRKARRKRQ